ncbi:unnamed protein product [Caenorhabditis nigoni]
MASLIEMPKHILDKVIGYSDFKAVLSLRQVCRDFRDFIDNLKDSKLPDSKFVTIDISCMESVIITVFMDSDYSYHHIEYSKMEGFRRFNGKTTVFENSSIVDVVIRDLEWILKFQKSAFKDVYLYFDYFETQIDTSIHPLLTKLSNMLNASGRKIKTMEIFTSTENKSHHIQVLQFADPEILKIIQFSSTDDSIQLEVDQIARTEQWKKAEEFECDFRVVNLNVEDICHFSKITITLNSISARILDSLRKAFLTSPKFEELRLKLTMFNEIEEIPNLWGPAFDSEYSLQWFFRMKDSEEKVLRIRIFQDDTFGINYHTRFSTIRVGTVPNGAIIQDYNGN